MKNHQLVNTLVIAGIIIAFAGAALFLVNGPRNDASELVETAQIVRDKAASVSTLVSGLEARLAASPDDAKGWILLARSHDHLGNRDRAWNAYSRARNLGMSDETLEIKLAANIVGAIEK